MPTRRLTLLLLCTLSLTGCDKLKALTGGETLDPKAMDAEAVGYACRVSQKAPEACMKENEAQSPSFVLSGWKKADTDIKLGTIDPSMSNARIIVASAVPAADAKDADGEHDAEADEGKSKSSKSSKKHDEDDEEKSDKSKRTDKTGKPESSGKTGKNDSSNESKNNTTNKSH